MKLYLDKDYTGIIEGRFELHTRSEGIRGRAAASQTRYTVVDQQTGKRNNLNTRTDVNCLVHYRLTGKMTAPFYPGVESTAPMYLAR